MTELSRRDVLATGAAVAASAVIPAAAQTAGSAPNSLNGIATTKGLRFGSCLGTGPSGAPPQHGVTDTRPNQFSDAAFRALFLAQCGVLVPENELKWYAVRPSATEFNFDRADKLMAFVQQNGLLVRGHTLLWNRNIWMPPWTQSYDFGSRPGSEAERLLTEHIAKVAGRYPQIFAWDVVNETIDPKTGGMEDSVFSKHIGPEVIDIAFHAARQAAPKAQLVYNDYMSWGPGNGKHRDGVIALLERLKKNKVPIDALGVQGHIGPGATQTTPKMSDDDEKEWRRFLDHATGLGLDLIVTEFDEGDQNMPDDIATRDQAVAEIARRYFDVMLSYPQLRYVMAWGLVDKYSWLQGRWLRGDGREKRPNPYDDNYQPKPLREAIAAALAAAPARRWML